MGIRRERDVGEVVVEVFEIAGYADHGCVVGAELYGRDECCPVVFASFFDETLTEK